MSLCAACVARRRNEVVKNREALVVVVVVVACSVRMQLRGTRRARQQGLRRPRERLAMAPDSAAVRMLVDGSIGGMGYKGAAIDVCFAAQRMRCTTSRKYA